MTKTISKKAVCPKIIGTGEIAGQPVEQTAVPVDNQMQAFLYRHLVPAQELVLTPVEQPSPLVFEVKVPKSGIIELPIGKEVKLYVTGRFRKGITGAQLKLDHPPEGIVVVKSWIGRKRAKGKTAAGKPKYEKGVAHGQIILKAGEPLKPGFETSLVVFAAARKGREETRYPAPAIPVKIVAPRPASAD